jgi:hypothetical protein
MTITEFILKTQVETISVYNDRYVLLYRGGTQTIHRRLRSAVITKTIHNGKRSMVVCRMRNA